jgi:hypothetical protein
VAQVKDDLESAARYRKHAEDLRTIAREWIDWSARQALLEVAEKYDHMARSRERINAMECQAQCP